MMNPAAKVTGEERKFPQIATSEELITYLNSSERLKNREFLYHYTTIEKAIRPPMS